MVLFVKEMLFISLLPLKLQELVKKKNVIVSVIIVSTFCTFAHFKVHASDLSLCTGRSIFLPMMVFYFNDMQP